ncbi:hypothetical protein M8C21_021741 [Ambrosia artemisiifolia]|uniref:Uncharacterized protein n=1 Tax=Ambrosia artemisiifolia TaxID=4212 RepID=A0AAD5D3I8_AMBAR|nr:hypothetical protein M8C21_021741 [Ambrosia artemisiifolia]
MFQLDVPATMSVVKTLCGLDNVERAVALMDAIGCFDTRISDSKRLHEVLNIVGRKECCRADLPEGSIGSSNAKEDDWLKCIYETVQGRLVHSHT